MTNHDAAPNVPMRDGSRNRSGGCLICGGALGFKRARYCSRAQAMPFRLRHRTGVPDLPSCERTSAAPRSGGTRSTSAQVRRTRRRRASLPDCHLFSRAVGVGGHCPECDSPVLLAELLGEEVLSSLSYPQRRANRRGHAALLAQSLENPCGVDHMPTPGATTTLRSLCLGTLIPTNGPTGGLMVVAIYWPKAHGE